MNSKESTLKLIADHFDISVSKVKTTDHLINDLGADSLDSIELVLQLEKLYDIEVSDEQIESIDTVQSILDLIDDLS